MESLNCDEIEAAAAKLVAENKDYLNPTVGVELVQYMAFFTHFPEDEDDKIRRKKFLYKLLINKKGWFWFCCSGRIPRLSLNQHSLYVGVVEKLLPHHSQGSSTERWSRNTLRVVTARVFYVLKGFLTSPLYFK